MNNSLFEKNIKETSEHSVKEVKGISSREGEIEDEEVEKLKRFKEKLDLGKEINREDVLGIEDFVYEKIKLHPHIMKQLDASSLKVAMDGYCDLKDIKGILKYASIESISNPEIIDLISYEIGNDIYDLCYAKDGFDYSEDDVSGLNQKGIQIISNKIADIVSERNSNEQAQAVSVILEIWKKYMEPSENEIENIKESVNEIVAKGKEAKYKKDDFKSIDVRYGEIEEVLDETISEENRVNNQEQGKKGQTQGDN